MASGESHPSNRVVTPLRVSIVARATPRDRSRSATIVTFSNRSCCWSAHTRRASLNTGYSSSSGEAHG